METLAEKYDRIEELVTVLFKNGYTPNKIIRIMSRKEAMTDKIKDRIYRAWDRYKGN